MATLVWNNDGDYSDRRIDFIQVPEHLLEAFIRLLTESRIFGAYSDDKGHVVAVANGDSLDWRDKKARHSMASFIESYEHRFPIDDEDPEAARILELILSLPDELQMLVASGSWWFDEARKKRL